MILGIDAGGTKTKVVVMDNNGDILHIGKGGPGNHLNVGIEGVLDVISKALGKFKDNKFDIAILALAGVGFDPEIRKYFADTMKKVIKSKNIEVYNDCYVALKGAIGKRKTGMLILSGTGSMVIGVDEEGKHHKVGGWGHLLGDEGSGYKISYDAIRAVMGYWEGIGPDTILKDAVFEYFGFKDYMDVIKFFYMGDIQRDKIASFSPYVIRCAEDKDFVAIQIIKNNIKELLSGIGSVKLQIEDDYISYGGGMFNSTYYKEMVEEELKIMGFKLHKPILSPIGGALFMGFEALKILNNNIFENLKSIA